LSNFKKFVKFQKNCQNLKNFCQTLKNLKCQKSIKFQTFHKMYQISNLQKYVNFKVSKTFFFKLSNFFRPANLRTSELPTSELTRFSEWLNQHSGLQPLQVRWSAPNQRTPDQRTYEVFRTAKPAFRPPTAPSSLVGT